MTDFSDGLRSWLLLVVVGLLSMAGCGLSRPVSAEVVGSAASAVGSDEQGERLQGLFPRVFEIPFSTAKAEAGSDLGVPMPTIDLVTTRVFLVSIGSSLGSLVFLYENGDGTLARLFELGVVGRKTSLDRRIYISRFEVNSPENLQAVVVEYRYASYKAGSDSYLAVCIFSNGSAESCETYAAGSSNFILGNRDPALRWQYLDPDSGGASRYWRTCPVLADLNRDGFKDLVLWRREFRSRSLREAERAEAPPFRMISESTLAMYFDADQRTFADPEPVDLPLPDPAACERAYFGDWNQ